MDLFCDLISVSVEQVSFVKNKLLESTFNPSIQEAEASFSVSSKPTCSTRWVLDQPELHRDPASKTKATLKKGTHRLYFLSKGNSQNVQERQKMKGTGWVGDGSVGKEDICHQGYHLHSIPWTPMAGEKQLHKLSSGFHRHPWVHKANKCKNKRNFLQRWERIKKMDIKIISQ